MIVYKKVFVDTAPLIYLLENHPVYFDRMKSLFLKWHETDIQVVTSAITLHEYCVYPYKQGKIDLITKFRHFLLAYGMDVYDIDADTAQKAAEIRSQFSGFKAMDALQLASAGNNQCDMFLTNDKQLLQYKEIPFLLVDEMEDV